MLDDEKIEKESQNITISPNDDTNSFLITSEIKVDVNDIVEINCDNENNHSTKY